jgi:hypothetical protein
MEWIRMSAGARPSKAIFIYDHDNGEAHIGSIYRLIKGFIVHIVPPECYHGCRSMAGCGGAQFCRKTKSKGPFVTFKDALGAVVEGAGKRFDPESPFLREGRVHEAFEKDNTFLSYTNGLWMGKPIPVYYPPQWDVNERGPVRREAPKPKQARQVTIYSEPQRTAVVTKPKPAVVKAQPEPVAATIEDHLSAAQEDIKKVFGKKGDAGE